MDPEKKNTESKSFKMDMDELKSIYSEDELQMMRKAEEARIPGKNRVEEIKSFARLSGIKRIGIAHCILFKKEALNLKERLQDEFEVFSIDCFNGRIPTSVLMGNDAGGISCNPAGQAAYLNNSKTELNISFGLCMGHDLIFNKKSKVPVTTLVVKDREHKHNPYKEFETPESPLK